MIKLFNSAIVSYNMTQDLLGFSTPVFTIEDGLPASSTFTPSLSDARDAAPVPQFAPTTLFQESFETDGNGTRYTSSSEFNDGISDHFQRTDGSTISNVTAGYSNIDGSFFIAGEDLDDGGGDGVDEKYITFNPINIAGQSNIDITAAFGAGNEGPLNASNYDALDWMGLFYRVDGGAWQIGVLFNADPNGADAFNDPLRQVDLSTISYAGGNTEASAVTGLLAGTDYTALIASGGTSTTLATALQDFTIDLGTQTGTSLEIVFGAHMDSGSEEIAFDNLRVTSEAGSSDTTPPTLVSTGPADDGTLNDTAADLTLTFDENIQLGTGNITIFNAADDTVFETFDVATSAAVTVSGSTVTINPTGTFTLTNGYYVQVAGTAITDTAGNAFAGISDETTFNFDVQALTIGAIQGTTDTSGFVGQTVTISAIVTGDHQTGTGEDGDLEGFFMQDGGDGNALTSDGIFVYDGNTTLAVDVSKGDRVSVTGIVSERFGKTVIDVSQGGSVTITNAGEVTDITTLITTIDMSTIGARTAGGDYRADFEAYESMLVDFQQTLTVTEVRDLDDFGEFLVSADGIPLSFTQQANNADINAVNFDAYLQQAGSQMFLIDDGQNGVGNPIIWPDGSLGTDDGFRNGSTIADAFGIMDFGFSNFRLQVVDTDNDNDITDEITIDTTANARPMSVGVDGELVIASVNVENFFSTLGSRGAQTAAELARQTDKVVEGLAAIDADIFGLQEIENDFNFDGTSALEVLVNALNAKVGAGTYAFVDPGVTAIGSDAIATAFIYKVGTVEVTSGTSTAILSDTDLAGLGITDLGDLGSVFNGSSTNRNPLAVSFTELATGHSFTAVNNHLKSKGGTGTGANADQNDGVASFNEVRLIGLQAIDAWLATNPTGLNDADNIIIGDLNAYAMEDPINYLVTNGYVDLNMSAVGSSDYGYWFDAFAGTLDYGIANAALAAQAVGFEFWNGNADEAEVLEYLQDFIDDHPGIFDGSTPWRFSDHDAAVISLNLGLQNGTENVDTLTGSEFDDTLNGLEENDRLTGKAGDDILNGGDGRDTIVDGNGDDTINGDAGNDRLFVGDGADTVDGGTGQDFVSYKLSDAGVIIDLNILSNNNGDAMGDTYTSVERFKGSDFDDRMIGSTGNDDFFGNAGNDFMRGREGNDTLIGGEGDDDLRGNIGDDLLKGGLDNDTLYGNEGNDILNGQEGDDRLIGGADDDRLFGGIGIDTLLGGDGNDRLSGGDQDDRLEGGEGKDILRGDGGNDTLLGGTENDNLIGGAGDDTMTGGAGRDFFRFLTTSDGTDTITDFDDDGNDVILFAAASGVTQFSDLTIVQSGNDVLITSTNHSITLTDTLLADVTASDFAFV